MGIFDIFGIKGKVCECGKLHTMPIAKVEKGKNAVNKIADIIKSLGKNKPFIFADVNTYAVAGERVRTILSENGIDYSFYVLSGNNVEPDEKTVGSVIMHMNYSCDVVIAIGSGVINDIGKIVSAAAGLPYVIVATAPSMDGYASASSSVVRDGLKYSLCTKCPDVIIGDTNLLKTAPLKMLKSGLGDMLAKYNSICEWKISHIIIGEYYCEKTANIVKQALKKCVDNASGLLCYDDAAVEAVFDGLVLCGAAMSYVNVSRPASGVEHYISHVWDMRGIAIGKKVELHGIQCAVGTRVAVNLYRQIKNLTPNRAQAIEFVNSFDLNNHFKNLRSYVGEGAESMIELEKKEGKYDKAKHSARLDVIIDNWKEIVKIIDEELPTVEELDELFNLIKLPKTPNEIGENDSELPLIFSFTKDIRDKYVLSRLAWDLGVINQLKF